MDNQPSIQVQIEMLNKDRNDKILTLQKKRDENIKKILDEISKIQFETQNLVENDQTEANIKIQQLKAELNQPKSAIKPRRPKNVREFSTKQTDNEYSAAHYCSKIRPVTGAETGPFLNASSIKSRMLFLPT